ncbi:MAG TPA: GDP-mannose 4,6-dehydratase [Cytophagaceae bacterium]
MTEYLLQSGANVTTILAHWHPNTHYVGSGLLHKVHNVIGNFSDYDLIDRVIKENGISTVFHLAGLSIEKLAFNAPRIAFEVNVRGTYNLLEACRNSPDPIEKAIVASSDKAYGDSPHLPYTEDMPLIGSHPYDCSKSCQEQVGTRHCRNSAMEL